MKALYFNTHGGLENLVYGDLDDPTPGSGEVLVRVKACAINHLDLWVLQGWPGLKLEMPHVGGADIAGVVASVGDNVSGIEEGTRVVVNPGYTTTEDEWTARGEDSVSPGYHIFGECARGGFAEYVAVAARNIHEIPDSLGFSEACAPLLVGLTSWRMLKKRAALRKGETCLIIGAGGGVNSFCVQLAKHLGANVIALTSTPEKMEKAKELGADEVVNYREQPEWAKEVLKLTQGRGADVVVDNVGKATMPQSIIAAARGGRIVTVGNTSGHEVSFDNRFLFVKQLTLLGSTMGSYGDFSELLEVLRSGTIKPVIDREMALEDGREAYELLEKGEQFGKVILTPK